MTWVAVGVAGVAAVSSLTASQASAAQQDQNAATQNADASQSIGNMQALEAQASAQEEAQRTQSAQYLGRQRAALGDSGTGSLGSGSNFDVARQSAVSAEIDALNVRYSGQLKGADALQTALNYRYGADNSAALASQTRSTMFSNAALSALSSGAGTYSRGLKGNTNLSAGTPGTGVNTYSIAMPSIQQSSLS